MATTTEPTEAETETADDVPPGYARCEECGDQMFHERGVDLAAERQRDHPRSLMARAFHAPEEYDYLCKDCLEAVHVNTAENMTDDELAAAIVSDSIGYASPTHAMKHVEAFRAGEERVCCERGNACYGGSLEKLIESARKHYYMKTPETRERLVAEMEAWRESTGGDAIADMTVSAMYPTR